MSDSDEIRPWRILDSELALDQPWYRVRRDTVALPNGQVLTDYYTSERPEIVLVFPVTRTGKVVAVRQYKHGAQRILLEFPGGIHSDPEEDLPDAARRELLEETGYEPETLRYLGAIWDDAAKQNNRLHLFLAEGVQRVQAQSLDQTEFIRVELIDLELVPEEIARGAICTAGAMALAYRAIQSLG